MPETTDLPNHRYYQACVGAWKARLTLQITDPAALAASKMSTLDRLSLRLMAAWPAWLGTFTMHTTVAYDPAGTVHHTTTATWLGLPLMNSRETIYLDPDGARFTMTGTQRVGLAKTTLTAEGTIDSSATKADYDFTWLGIVLHQATTRDGDTVTLAQTGPGFTGAQVLQRQ